MAKSAWTIDQLTQLFGEFSDYGKRVCEGIYLKGRYSIVAFGNTSDSTVFKVDPHDLLPKDTILKNIKDENDLLNLKLGDGDIAARSLDVQLTEGHIEKIQLFLCGILKAEETTKSLETEREVFPASLHDALGTQLFEILDRTLNKAPGQETKGIFARTRGSKRFIDTSVTEAVRATGIKFVQSVFQRTIATVGDGSQIHVDDIHNSFFDNCDSISTLKYESTPCRGNLIIVSERNPTTNPIARLTNPVPLNMHRNVRKLLEISDEKRPLIVTNGQIIGWGRLGLYEPQVEDLFWVDFLGDHSWQLRHERDPLILVDKGRPRCPERSFQSDELEETLVKFNSNQHQNRFIIDFVRKVISSQKGAMLVVSSNAEEETNRLGNQCFPIDKRNVNDDLLHAAFVDGAILLDFEANCYAFGVILDGEASNDIGKSSRGARYNSALR
ncbi:MAG: hypothetical protein P1V97_36545, partial [Planctomycetota bacterium]|nr:hypothetical protein [Planctomycetota bacterium]